MEKAANENSFFRNRAIQYAAQLSTSITQHVTCSLENRAFHRHQYFFVGMELVHLEIVPHTLRYGIYFIHIWDERFRSRLDADLNETMRCAKCLVIFYIKMNISMRIFFIVTKWPFEKHLIHTPFIWKNIFNFYLLLHNHWPSDAIMRFHYRNLFGDFDLVCVLYSFFPQNSLFRRWHESLVKSTTSIMAENVNHRKVQLVVTHRS